MLFVSETRECSLCPSSLPPYSGNLSDGSGKIYPSEGNITHTLKRAKGG